jgi:hypothetical protein
MSPIHAATRSRPESGSRGAAANPVDLAAMPVAAPLARHCLATFIMGLARDPLHPRPLATPPLAPGPVQRSAPSAPRRRSPRAR